MCIVWNGIYLCTIVEEVGTKCIRIMHMRKWVKCKLQNVLFTSFLILTQFVEIC